MQQIIFIHGGTSFNSYERYIEDLKSKAVHKDRLTYSPVWFQLMGQSLSSKVEVLLPTMPNKQNASYSEWCIWFERLQEVAEEDAIYIGHSLGAIFLAKYLAGNKLKKTAKAVLMLAGPYSDESQEDLGGFTIGGEDDLSHIYESTNRVVVVHAPDDPVVDVQEQERYKKALPMAEYRLMPGSDHFMRADFPEMIDLIESLIDS